MRNYRILAEKKYSSHKDDDHISIVLCRVRDKEWVTWICTRENNKREMNLGRYFNSPLDAIEDFLTRGTFSLAKHGEEARYFLEAERRQHEENI